jgi:MoaA/NifB/PqqE/SkfB family radical SAM enzyme
MLFPQKKKSFATQVRDWVLDHVWTQIDPQDHIFHLQIDITNACNLACTHCYLPHHKNSGALTFEDWCRVIDQYQLLLAKLHMQADIVICGGEPLLSPFLFPLIEYIRGVSPDCELHILTNGILVTTQIAQTMRRWKVKAQVSIDGPDASRHDLIRGAGSFAKTMQGCEMLRAADVSFHHLAVLSHRTTAWIADFFEVAKATGATHMNFVRLVTFGHAESLVAAGSDRPLKGLPLKQALTDIVHLSRAKGVETNTDHSLFHLIEPGLGSPNNIGFSGLVVDYQGRIKVSSRVPSFIGHVFKEGLEALFFEHPVMQKLRRGEIEGCGTCPDFKKCRGDRNASFESFGHFFGPDEGCFRELEISQNKNHIHQPIHQQSTQP